MSKNIKYSIEEIEGNFVARSTVNSFNLDHITDKDVTSFYKNISSQALFDTGLMPLNGTGVLSIRSAGNHTQIAYQHAPQMSYINWGKNEGDAHAISYYVAQPYRIWIADLVDGNLYGARMFYSPYPITSSNSILYHINLPNTNCQGYRGNGVGWICLYHTEDWSNLSFNVKIQKLIERCSGIETYNDANMSETDGPRFYAKNQKPEYVINPLLWQQKSEQDGIDWTLDPDLWIPVLVKDIDNQDRHYSDGQPLTFAMALLGTYNSYYNDSYNPKLINAFAREDIEIPVKRIFQIFSTSYNSSSTNQESFNQFQAESLDKEMIASLQLSKPNLFTSDESSNTFYCVSCENSYDADEYNSVHHDDEMYCENCFSEYFVYCENTQKYLHSEDDDLEYIEHEQIYIDSSYADFKECPNCKTNHWVEKNSGKNHSIYNLQFMDDSNIYVCSCCTTDFLDHLKEEYSLSLEENYSNYHQNCSHCGTWVIANLPIEVINPCVTLQSIYFNLNNDLDIFDKDSVIDYVHNKSNFEIRNNYYCPTHAATLEWSPSGRYVFDNTFIYIDPWVSFPIKIEKTQNIVSVKITALPESTYYSDWHEEGLPHPFRQTALGAQSYLLSLASVIYGVAPLSSPYMTVYNEVTGEEYTSY
jgi:hypothetical protein